LVEVRGVVGRGGQGFDGAGGVSGGGEGFTEVRGNYF